MKTSIAAAWLAPALAVALVACKGGGDAADRPAPTGAATGSAPTTAPAASAGAAKAADEAAPGVRLCGDFEACRAACAERRPAACLRMSQQAANGAEREAAGKLLRQLCDAGHGESCFGVYLAGRGKDKKMLARSCDIGSGWGCLTLAASVRPGNASRAAELYARGMRQLEKSCQHDDPFSCAKIAAEARSGDDADPARARWHGEKACDLGEEDACWAVADQLRREFPDVSAARMDRACELGHPVACLEVGDRLAGQASPSAADMQRAASAWQVACDSETSTSAYPACAHLAEALTDGSLPRDPGRAEALRARHEQLAGELEGG